MCNSGCSAVYRELRKPSGLHAAFGSDAQWLCVTAQYIAGNQVTDHIDEKTLAGIYPDMLDRTERQRPLLQVIGSARVDSTSVDRRCNDIAAVGSL